MLLQRNLSQNLLRDLVAISGLPGLWGDQTPPEIATGLAGVLLNTLHLSLVYITLDAEPGQDKVEVACSESGHLPKEAAREMGRQLQSLLSNPEAQEKPITINNPLGYGILRAIVTPVGTTKAQGYLVAASSEFSFPDESNRLLLRITVNQAAVILRQKQVEEQLRHKQQELTDFFENASEALHWVGPDGTILWANQAELDLLGYTREEYIGHRMADFYVDPVIAENIRERLVSDQPVQEYEARLRCKNGSVKHVLISSTIYRENGKFIHTRCFTRDITERKQMEEVLRRAYDDTEMRVQFRTKELSAAIEALKEEIASRRRAETEVSELRRRLSDSRESERLLLAQELHDGPIQDLFALSYKLGAYSESAQDSEFKSMQEEVLQVVGTLRKLCEELRPSALISYGLGEAIQSHLEQFKQQYPSYEVHSELMEAEGLPERISLTLYRIYQQALMNIIRHAHADRIVVRFLVETDHVLLEVQDNGRGFIVPTNWIDFAREGHFGLIGGFERAEAVGGKLIIESSAGNGTRLQVRVPLNTEPGKGES